MIGGGSVRTIAAFALALVMTGSVALGDPSAIRAIEWAGGSGQIPRWLELERTLNNFVPIGPLLSLVEGPSAVDTGSDGRLTVMLLGSDARGGGVGLTDTVMFVTLKGNSIAAASIPRDTARIRKAGGGTYVGRINSLLKKLRAESSSNAQALNKMKNAMEYLLQIEIDYYALIKFNGFTNLVSEVDPITVNVKNEIHDSRFWDDPNKPSGVFFGVDSSTQILAYQPTASKLCNGLWKSMSLTYVRAHPEIWCRRAIPFVRSRKGGGNSDFVRARRQQDFVIAAIKRVIARGDGSNLSSLVNKGNNQEAGGLLYTDLPLTLSNALQLYNDLAGANPVFQVVFKPTTYSTHIPNTTAYELKLSVVRQTMAQWFK